MKKLLVVLVGCAGCSTLTPMQTASVVPLRGLRAGGQLSVAGFCGSIPGGVLGLTQCTDYPDGIPLPELRGNVRYGVAPRVDVGGSLQVQAQLFAPERPFQLGLTLDAKGEVLRVPTAAGPTHVLSAGVLGGGALAGRLSFPLWAQLEWGVPVFYGLQFDQVELVANVSLGQRFTASPNASPSTNTARLGFALGVYKRNPSGIAVQVSYLTDPARFSTGALQLQVGYFFDVL